VTGAVVVFEEAVVTSVVFVTGVGGVSVALGVVEVIVVGTAAGVVVQCSTSSLS
jgi:hypothetical protein